MHSRCFVARSSKLGSRSVSTFGMLMEASGGLPFALPHLDLSLGELREELFRD
jgi:hypothetical protein